jgi:hypothetical protein
MNHYTTFFNNDNKINTSDTELKIKIFLNKIV